MSVNWRNDKDRATIYAMVDDDHDRGCLEFVEEVAQAWEPGKPLDFALNQLYSPDQIANGLLLIVNYFEGGEMFFATLSVLEKALISHVTALIIQIDAQMAATASHRQEGDETLSDSE